MDSGFERDKSSSLITGSGLGLSIANKITDMHQGNISVSSKLKEGTESLAIVVNCRFISYSEVK
jgi:signal transduction histidine kinase